MKTVTYSSYSLLSCAPCSGEVVICISDTLTVGTLPFIDAVISSYVSAYNACGKMQYTYNFTYNEADLLDPNYSIVESDIEGVFCRGCLTTYIDTVAAASSAGCEGVCCVTTYDEFLTAIDVNNTDCKQVIVAASFTVPDSNVTLEVHKPVTVLQGCIITSNQTYVRFFASFTAGIYQVFAKGASAFPSFYFYFSPGAVTEVYPEWFGAAGDGTADDTYPIMQAYYSGFAEDYDLIQSVVVFQSGKVYACSRLELWMGGSEFRSNNLSPVHINWNEANAYLEGCATLKNNDVTHALFYISSWEEGESGISFKGLRLNGGGATSSAAPLILTDSVSRLHVENCGFYNSNFGIRITSSDTVITHDFGEYIIRNNVFYNVVDSAIEITSDWKSYRGIIEENTFLGQVDYSIVCYDSDTGTGDPADPEQWKIHQLIIDKNWFAATSAIRSISLDMAKTYHGMAGIISNNRFDGPASQYTITLGWFDSGANEHETFYIHHNEFRGVSPTHVRVWGGRFTNISDNFFSNASTVAIDVQAGSLDTYIGLNSFGSGADACVLEISDAGTRTHIMRLVEKNDSLSRPLLLPCDLGSLYLDTTLDADGLPIFWNGVKWIKADGTDA